MMKAERGEAVGEYLFILAFDSQEIRDLYFPQAGQPSGVFNSIMNTYGGRDVLRSLYDRLWEQVERSASTDYVAIQ